MYRVPRRLTLAVALLGSLPHGAAQGEDLPETPSFFDALKLPPGRVETSNGVDGTGAAWSVYSGAVIAPFGPLHQDGLRLKLSGGMSAWSHENSRVYCALSAEEKKKATGTNFSKLCNEIANRQLTPEQQADITASIAPSGLHLEGDQIYQRLSHKTLRYDAAVMGGYQLNWPDVTLKAYLGPAMETRNTLPADPEKLLAGAYWGVKTALESWMALGEGFWLSADTSYFTGTQAYSASLRTGYQPLSWLAMGPEAAAFGDEEHDSARAGGFLRMLFGQTEATVSGGISADYDGGTGLYGSAGIYTKF
jgi:hypothetical protein